MTFLRVLFQRSRLPLLLVLCILALTATAVYAGSDLRPLAAVTILGAPDAAVTGKFAVGTASPGNKALTVAGVIDFVGAGTGHNFFTQGPGNNMQIRANVDEANTVYDATRSQWNLVLGSAKDSFAIKRSPPGATYNEDALFWINGSNGRIGVGVFDTANGANPLPVPQAQLDVETTSGDAIRGVSTAVSGYDSGVWGQSDATGGRGVYGLASATSGANYGVYGESNSTYGRGVYGVASAASGTTYGVYGFASATSGIAYGVYGESASTSGRGVYGWASAHSGNNYGIYGLSESTSGRGVYGHTNATSGSTCGLCGESASTSGRGVFGVVSAASGSTYGVYGRSESTSGRGVYGYVSATSGGAIGVYGQSESTAGTGVYGWISATSGTNYGVRGYSSSASGYDFYAAGAGTDYGPFTGAHEVRLAESFPQRIKAGMIVSAAGEAQIRQTADGGVDISSTMPTVRLADATEDKAVFGALVAEVTLPEDHWYAAGENERFASVNALGEGRVWVSNLNGDIEAGDYITTSTLPGYGQLQNDDLLHNYTLGKATETIDWDTVVETVKFNGQTYKVYLLAVVYMSG